MIGGPVEDRSAPTYPPGHDGRWAGPLLADRVAVVTGGAGAIGAATCSLFADQGADVVVVDHDPERTAAVVADVEGRGRQALGVVCDLEADDTIEDMAADVLARFGRVDVLVNAMGHAVAPAAPFEAGSRALWDQLYRASPPYLPRVRAGDARATVGARRELLVGRGQAGRAGPGRLHGVQGRRRRLHPQPGRRRRQRRRHRQRGGG